MNTTHSDKRPTTSAESLSEATSLLPSQASELAEIENRERSRVEQEAVQLRHKEELFASELRTLLREEEERFSKEASATLKTFKEKDLGTLLSTERKQADLKHDTLKEHAEKNADAATKALLDAVLSDDFTSRL